MRWGGGLFVATVVSMAAAATVGGVLPTVHAAAADRRVTYSLPHLRGRVAIWLGTRVRETDPSLRGSI